MYTFNTSSLRQHAICISCSGWGMLEKKASCPNSLDNWLVCKDITPKRFPCSFNATNEMNFSGGSNASKSRSVIYVSVTIEAMWDWVLKVLIGIPDKYELGFFCSGRERVRINWQIIFGLINTLHKSMKLSKWQRRYWFMSRVDWRSVDRDGRMDFHINGICNVMPSSICERTFTVPEKVAESASCCSQNSIWRVELLSFKRDICFEYTSGCQYWEDVCSGRRALNKFSQKEQRKLCKCCKGKTGKIHWDTMKTSSTSLSL